ncbi:MAG TPA: EAL domain-containing protein, partial [Thermomicrobiales bacterium]|nr:EAL domain-containing protein [Thermomicrobiales bacterium]
PITAVHVALQQHVAMRRRAETNLAAAQEVAHLGSIDWDPRIDDQQWSQALFDLLGLSQRSMLSSTRSYLSVVHPDDRTEVDQTFARARLGEEYAIDHRIVRPDGEERFVHSRGEVVPGRDGLPHRIVGTVHDVTERKQLEARLEHQAFHDPLTDLPNRALFTRRLDEALLHRGDESTDFAVLFLDLDRFKLINDTLGHEAGDQLLIAVGMRLRGIVRLPGDVVARLGGDEFTVLLDDVRGDAEAIGVAERIIAAMTAPITLLENREIVVSTSVGIVRPGPDHQTGADVLRDADNALYRAKEGGRNRYAVFDASMGAETAERLALEADLRRALARDELRVTYQPKIELATARVVAVEAFLRWDHPTRGWIAPARFIPIAEETGQIGDIGAWVLGTACRVAATWDRVTPDPPILSINLSGKQLHDPDFAAALESLLAETGLAPRRLRLEIAETTAMKNAEATIQALGRLQEIGVRVVIDDFGTGSSSLTFLRRFPVDTLQLDHSFVADLGANPDATKVAQAVIGLAHGLGLQVVAEGVERPDQLAQLRALGCEQAQGNLFAPPLPAPDLAAYLASRRPTEPSLPAANGTDPAPVPAPQQPAPPDPIPPAAEADSHALLTAAEL